MKGNALYYKEVGEVKEKWFQPRQEAVDYVERDEDEQALLDYIESNFIFDENKEEKKTDNESETSEDDADLDADEFIAKVWNTRFSL